MPEVVSNDSLRAVIMLEAHKYVDDATAETMERLATLPVARTASAEVASPEFDSLSSIPATMRVAMVAAIGELRIGTTLPYPPSNDARFTDDELAAVADLRSNAAALSAIRKLVRSGAAAPLFRLFCLLDAVADPELTSVTPWLPITLTHSREDDAPDAMMHDEFTDAFHRYARRVDG